MILTPKAFASFSPGLERRDNPGIWNKKTRLTLKALGLCADNPFRVETNFDYLYPGLSLPR